MHAEIRLASNDDLALLLGFVRAYHQFEGLRVTDAEREQSVRRLMSDHGLGAIWLILDDARPVGYVALCKGYSIEFGGYDAFIDELYVQPESRGRGLGKAGIDLVKTEAKRMGIRALHLEVARTNQAARRLYAEADFEAREKYVLMSAVLR